MTKTVSAALFGAVSLLAASAAIAAPVNGTGLVTPDVIYGSGNANGAFTGVTVSGVELALRAHLRYDATGNPQNVFNYDGADSYFFTNIGNAVPAGRSVFNFDFSINTDASGTTGLDLDDLTYLLFVDNDPTAAASGLSFDPCVVIADNSLGTNATPNGGGTEAPACGGPGSGFNVAQQSHNLGFGYSATPQAPGQYTISLSAFSQGTLIASTAIDVFVDTAPVPAPGALGLLGLGLVGIGAMRRRRGA